jgi:hypothetical protein
MSMGMSMEDIGALEFGRGLGKLIPDDQNMSQKWLREYYKKVPGTYPGMSTGAVSNDSAPITGSGAGFGNRGLIESERPVRITGSGASFGSSSTGKFSGDARMRRRLGLPEFKLEDEEAARKNQQDAEKEFAESEGKVWFRKSSGSRAGPKGQVPLPHDAKPLSQAEWSKFVMSRAPGFGSGSLTPEQSRGVFAALSGLGEAEKPAVAPSPLVRALSSPWLWVGVAVLAGVYLVNRRRS